MHKRLHGRWGGEEEGGREKKETLQIDFLRESSESFQFAFPCFLVRQMRGRVSRVVNYALT